MRVRRIPSSLGWLEEMLPLARTTSAMTSKPREAVELFLFGSVFAIRLPFLLGAGVLMDLGRPRLKYNRLIVQQKMLHRYSCGIFGSTHF